MSAQALKTKILKYSQEEASNSSWRQEYLSCHLPPLLKFLKPCALFGCLYLDLDLDSWPMLAALHHTPTSHPLRNSTDPSSKIPRESNLTVVS